MTGRGEVELGSSIGQAPPARSWRTPPPIGQGLAVIAVVLVVVLASLFGIAAYLFSLRIAAARTELAHIERRTAERRGEVRLLRQDYEIRSRFGQLDRWRTPLDLQPTGADQLVDRAGDIASSAAERRQAMATARAEARPVDAGTHPGYPEVARQRLDDLIGEIAAH